MKIGRMNGENRKQLILDQTLKLLQTKSIDALRTAEIAKVSGISEGALFKYFKTKNEIIYRIIEAYLGKSHPLTSVENINNIDQFRTFIDNYMTSLIKMDHHRIPYLKLLLQISMEHHPLALQKYVNVVDGFWKISENRIEYGKKHWGFNPLFESAIQIRLLHLSILMFFLEQEVFGAKEIDPFDLNNVKNIAIKNFFNQLTQQ